MPENKDNSDSISLAHGASIIIVGMVFLLKYSNILDPGDNWWALFFLVPIPMITGFAARKRARQDFWARNSAITSCLMLILFSGVFLFNISWDRAWPGLIIAVGTSYVISRFTEKKDNSPATGDGDAE